MAMSSVYGAIKNTARHQEAGQEGDEEVGRRRGWRRRGRRRRPSARQDHDDATRTVGNLRALAILLHPQQAGSQGFPVPDEHHDTAVCRWSCRCVAHVDTGALERPKVFRAQLAAILPMAMVHTIGSLYSNMSPGKIAVSFTHNVVKAQMEKGPAFPVVLYSVIIFLAQLAIPWFVLFLGTIMISQSRTVLGNKTLTVKEEEPLNSINLFSIITVMSLVLMACVTLLTEGVQVTLMQPVPKYPMCLLAALCFHAYQQGLYTILARLIPCMSVEQRRRR